MLFHDSFVAHLDQSYAHEYPEEFANTGVEGGIYAHAASSNAKNLHDDGDTALAGSELHRQEEEQVAHQRGESQNQEGIGVGNGQPEGLENKEKFKAVDETSHVFASQTAPECARVLVKQVGGIAIDLLHGFNLLVVEFARRLLDKRNVEETDFVEFDDETVLIAIAENNQGRYQNHQIDGKKTPEPGLHLLEVEGDKYEDARGPEKEMRENVHHGIQYHAAHGARRADVVGQLHNTIWSAAKAEGRGITKSETRYGKFVRMAVGEVLVVLAVIDDNLESPSVEGIYKHPHANDGRQIEAGADDVLAYLFVAVLKTERHDDEGRDAEEEEEISKFCTHREGELLVSVKVVEKRIAQMLVAAAHIDIEPDHDGDFKNGINPRMSNHYSTSWELKVEETDMGGEIMLLDSLS